MRRSILLLLPILFFFCSPKTDQVITGAIAYTLGNDTTMVQQFELKGNELSQTWIHRTPEVQIITGKAILSNDGNILSLKASYFKPDINGGKTLQFINQLEYKNDTTYVTLGYNDPPVTRAIPGYIMTTNMMKPIGMFWHAQMAYFAPLTIGDNKVNNHVVFASPIDFRLTRTSKNEVTVGSDAMGAYRILMDDSGKVTGVDGTASSFNINGTVVESIDMDAVTKRFLKYEITIGKLGSLTGKGEVTGQIGETNISITYSRPFQRGRKIFGGIVPWDKVWRTGANAASKMTVDAPLTIGEAELEAGEYSLWSIPHQNGDFELIINSQANVWGTNHDAAFDLYSIPMQVQQLNSPIEQFTISLDNGELSLAWENWRGSVEMR